MKSDILSDCEDLGRPEETQEDETMRLTKKCNFAQAYTAKHL